MIHDFLKTYLIEKIMNLIKNYNLISYKTTEINTLKKLNIYFEN